MDCQTVLNYSGGLWLQKVEVISGVSAKFKLALNNWTKTFKCTLYLKRNWCRQCSWWLMSWSSWAAGIYVFFLCLPLLHWFWRCRSVLPHLYLKIQKTVRSPPKYLRLQIGKKTASTKTIDSENREKCFGEDPSLKLFSYSCCLRFSLCSILATCFLWDATHIGRLASV